METRKSRYGPNEPRACIDCGETKPADEFYTKLRYEDGTTRTRFGYCKACALERQRRTGGHKPRQKKMSKAEKRMRRVAQQAQRMRDPEYAARHRARKTEQARRRRERAKTDAATAAAFREAQRRARAKRVADPERQAMFLVDQRIRYHTEHDARWITPNAVESYQPPTGTVDESVEALPFVLWVSGTFPGLSSEELGPRLLIDPRRLDAMFGGDQQRVSLHVVDRALTTGLGRPDVLNSLYPL